MNLQQIDYQVVHQSSTDSPQEQNSPSYQNWQQRLIAMVGTCFEVECQPNPAIRPRDSPVSTAIDLGHHCFAEWIVAASTVKINANTTPSSAIAMAIAESVLHLQHYHCHSYYYSAIVSSCYCSSRRVNLHHQIMVLGTQV